MFVFPPRVFGHFNLKINFFFSSGDVIKKNLSEIGESSGLRRSSRLAALKAAEKENITYVCNFISRFLFL